MLSACRCIKEVLTCPAGCLKRDNFQTLSFLDCSWTAGPASEEKKERNAHAVNHDSAHASVCVAFMLILCRAGEAKREERDLQQQHEHLLVVT